MEAIMPTVIRLSPDMKLSDIQSKKDRKYLLLLRGNVTCVACADNLVELEGYLHERGIPFDAANAKLFEMPGDTDMEYVVDTLGSQLDVIFGMKGERYSFRGPN